MKRFCFSVAVALFSLTLVSCSLDGKYLGATREFRVGAVLPLSGSAAQYGMSVQEGIKVALLHLQEDHPGTVFKIIYEDDRNTPDRSVDALNKLITTEQVKAVIGGVTSSCASPIASIAQQKKIILISPSASAPPLSEIGDHFFRVWSSDEFASRQLAMQLVERFGPKSVGLLYVNNDYGQGVLNVLSEEFVARGVKLSATEGYSPGTRILGSK